MTKKRSHLATKVALVVIALITLILAGAATTVGMVAHRVAIDLTARDAKAIVEQGVNRVVSDALVSRTDGSIVLILANHPAHPRLALGRGGRPGDRDEVGVGALVEGRSGPA